jgi:uncharacterized membrane protein SirB2
MLSTISALTFSFLAAAVTAFQLALACGAPWGEFTLGGKYPGRLPKRMRLVPVLSGLLLIGFVVVILARAGLAFSGLAENSRALVWFVVAYCAVGVFANYFTPSRRERAVWFPVVLLMLMASAIVALH